MEIEWWCFGDSLELRLFEDMIGSIFLCGELDGVWLIVGVGGSDDDSDDDDWKVKNEVEVLDGKFFMMVWRFWKDVFCKGWDGSIMVVGLEVGIEFVDFSFRY